MGWIYYWNKQWYRFSLALVLADDEREPMPRFEINSGEDIVKEEVEKAIRSMKNGKVTGPDDIPV